MHWISLKNVVQRNEKKIDFEVEEDINIAWNINICLILFASIQIYQPLLQSHIHRSNRSDHPINFRNYY